MFTRHLQDFVSPLILFVSCVASAPLAMAQINTASLTGQILDPGGAAASGAVVMARNRATTVEQTVTADEAGYDTFAILPVGLYDVTVELKGFKKAVRESISLEVGQKARIDLTLEVGTVDETVLVEATVPCSRRRMPCRAPWSRTGWCAICRSARATGTTCSSLSPASRATATPRKAPPQAAG